MLQLSEDFSHDLKYPLIHQEDIDQEVELLKLQGVTTVRREFVRRRLTPREALYGLSLPERLESPIQTEDLLPDPEVLERIITWASGQGEEIFELIIDFLDDPEVELDRVLKTLQTSGLIERPKRPQKIKSLRGFLMTQLAHRPHSLSELYELTRQHHPAARPEAATRQTLRRLLRQGLITQEDQLFRRTDATH